MLRFERYLSFWIVDGFRVFIGYLVDIFFIVCVSLYREFLFIYLLFIRFGYWRVGILFGLYGIFWDR